MEWISFFEKRPKPGQKIFYYGEPIGVWYGEYRYVPEDLCSPHLILSLECAGVVDRMDAPHGMKLWRLHDGWIYFSKGVQMKRWIR